MSYEKVKARSQRFINHAEPKTSAVVSTASFLILLGKKKILYEYRDLPRVHNREFVEPQVEEFLDVATRHLKK